MNIYSTSSSVVDMKSQINYKRLAWLIFIILYTGLFFYNCLTPYNNWFIPYVYTIIMILWLGKEYYFKNLFFQSGFLPIELSSFLLRGLFALFFYSAFIIGISTVVWWHKTQIGLYPVLNLFGVGLLIASIVIREKTFKEEVVTLKGISNFYLSIILLVISLALGYGSYFLVGYVIIIGFPLIFLQQHYEKNLFQEFENFVNSYKHDDNNKKKKINQEDYLHLWERYLEKKLKTRKK